MLGRTNTGGGSGGGGLNFKVIPNPMPSTAKENTIWVDTDKINNYHFSAEQPENMAEYDVWFLTGTSSDVAFSATKKNPVMVYPLSAKQYISGAWVDKTAKSYQGAWVDWIIYLFKDGDQVENITGGWRITAGNLSFTDMMEVKQSSSSGFAAASVITNKSVDVTRSKSLKVFIPSIHLSTNAGANTSSVYVSLKDASGRDVARKDAFDSSIVGTVTDTTVEIDLSTVSGEFYVAINLNVAAISTNTLTVKVSSVALVP